MASHTILVVDDDEDIRDALGEVLRTTGRKVMTASNGREALDLLRSGQRICLVLLDLKMPVMDGYRFLDAQKRDRAVADVPVAVISAGEVDHAKLGSTTVLSKPLKLPQLMAVIARYC